MQGILVNIIAGSGFLLVARQAIKWTNDDYFFSIWPSGSELIDYKLNYKSYSKMLN